MSRTFHLVSLGCPKNLVDSEVVYGLLEEHGWRGLDEPGQARVLIVNTCGFIEPAVEESIAEILELGSFKQDDPARKLVVIGCLVQRYREQLVAALDEVDLFIGTEGVPQIPGLLSELLAGPPARRLVVPDMFLMDARTPRRLSTPAFRAWLKITEGCDNHCSYCLIPSIRGSLRSREIGDLVAEARNLEAAGVVELSLIAQDLTAYGRDLYRQPRLTTLVERLLEETTIPWIRLLYLYPATLDEELLRLVAANPRVVPYLDIPLQHVSSRILRAMNRRYTAEDIATLLATIRRIVPAAALRTTLLLGFPGETEGDVEDIIGFLRRERLDHVGIFAYANESGAVSERLDGQLDEAEKAARVERVAAVQAEVSAAGLKRFVGTVQPVLVEGYSRESELLLEGRTRYQAPEIDGCVLITEGETRTGAIVDVEITGAQTYDLVGRIVAGT